VKTNVTLLFTEDMAMIRENRAAARTFARFIPIGTSRLLYHYTSLDAAVSIITSGRLWASDVRYLNDPTEQVYAHRLITEVIDEESRRLRGPAKKEIMRLPKLLSEALRSFEVFFTSFSEKGDLLSQWVGYTPSGRGLSLAFRGTSLRTLKGFALFKVLYAPPRQREAVRSLVRIYRDGFVRALRAKDNALVSGLWTGLGMLLQNCMLSFKDPAYASEVEWRLLYFRVPESPLDWPLRHRATGRAVVPYLDVVIPRNRRTGVLPIADIVVGPVLQYESVTPGIRSLLRGCVGDAVALRKSNVPFRDLR
jgi:hypothetical protein